MPKVPQSIADIRKKSTYIQDLVCTSYHEAGHAIFTLLHNMRVPSILLFENKSNKRIEGYCRYETPIELEDIKDQELFDYQLIAEIKIKYAGLASEKYHFKTVSGSDKFPMFLRYGSSDDTLSAAALIKQYDLSPSGKKRYNYKQKLIKDTTLLLQEHWDAVTLVSHQLFRKKKINFRQLKSLLIKKTKNPEFWKNKFKKIEFIFKNLNELDELQIKSIFIDN